MAKMLIRIVMGNFRSTRAAEMCLSVKLQSLFTISGGVGVLLLKL